MVAPLPTTLFSGPSLGAASPDPVAQTAEGVYVDLLALPPARHALMLGAAEAPAVGVILPLDGLFEDRVIGARRLLRSLTGRKASPADISPYRRYRLKLALRALDASLDEADYRAVAEALFGARVPQGSAFRDDSLRAQAIRLVRYGKRLMNGGYLDLLRPDHRRPRRR